MKTMAKKVKMLLCAGLLCLAALIGGILLTPVHVNAATLSSTGFQTDGSSIRVLKWNGESYEETDKAGIRFHVEMGAGHSYDGTTLLSTAEEDKNPNGSFKMADGFKTYTLILPTRLLGGSSDLNLDIAGVMKIDTTEYWFEDSDGNWESVAYIYNIPQKYYTDEFTFRGIICTVDENGNEEVVDWTTMSARRLVEVAKLSYNDTIKTDSNYWGTAEWDDYAAPKIKAFIPTYSITYTDGSTEEVLWNEKLTKATEGTWYNETLHESIDVTQPLTFAESCDLTLAKATEATFVLTGVEYTANGFDVYATLPTEYFKNGTTLEASAVDMVKNGSTPVEATAVSVSVEGSGKDAISKLKISFSYESISNGDTLTILKTSNFYYNGVLYTLEVDYDFEYNNAAWELPLGQITLADFASIKNYTETGSNGVEENIRATFNSDFLVNGNATLEGNVYITRKDGTVETIENGYYYWNQGEVSILEMPAGTNLWGEEDGDVLTIEAGTKLVQNNGYYEFAETITATFNGAEDWAFEYDTHNIDASAFTAAYTRTSDDGTKIYVDVETSEQWVEKRVKVVCNEGTLTYRDMNSATETTPNEVFYHGENGNKILRIYIDEWSETGDSITIPAGIAFWVGNQIYTLTEDVTLRFVDTGTNGMTWVKNPTINPVGRSNIAKMGWYTTNIRYTTTEIWSTAANNRVVVDSTNLDGNGIICDGTSYTNFYYYGGENSLLELQGANFGASGGSVTIKTGVIFWLFNNADNTFMGAYQFTEDLAISVSGAAGSQMYRDIEVASVSKSEITNIYNDSSHSGEIRFVFNECKVTGMYGAAEVEGSATLKDEATTSAFVYGGDGTSGYTGNTIIAFTGESLGKSFQASAIGDKISIADGTKIWLSNGSGYVTITGDWNYVWNGSAYVEDKQYTVTFSSENATFTIDGAEVSSKTVQAGEKVTFAVTVPTGYDIVSVSNATDNGDGTYTTANVFADVTVTAICAEPIKISQEDVTYFAKQGTGELRIALNKERTDISAITGGNYNITHSGTTEMTIGGVSVQPTQYNYYGVIDGTNHQLLGLNCDVASMKAGDYLTIKAGTTFKFGNTVLLLEGDIATKFVSITANFDSSVATLSVDGNKLEDGVELSTFVGGSSTIVFGWIDTNNAAIYDLSVKINDVEQGNSGTYTVDLQGDVVIDVTTTKKTYAVTWSNPTGATISVTANGSAISSGTAVEVGTSISVTATASSGYQVTGVTANGSSIGTTSGTYTVSGATTIAATTVKTYAVTWSNPTGATISVTANGSAISSGTAVVDGTLISVSVAAETGYNVTGVTANGSSIGTTSGTYTVSSATTIAATTALKTYTLTVTATNAEVSGVSNGQTITHGETYEFTVTANTDYTLSTVTINGTDQGTGGSYSFTASQDTTIEVTATESSSGSEQTCLAEGTLITLADGTKRAVEDIRKGDMVMAFDHLTGEIVYKDVIIVVKTSSSYYKNTFVFDDGTELVTINEHGIFDLDLNKYVNISRLNASEYIGHMFVSIDTEGNIGVKKLIDVLSVYETGYKYDIVTNETLNYVAEDTLSVTHVLVDVINSFDFGEDLMYDQAKMQADIEEYGLYTYDEWEEYCDISVFEQYNIPVMKVGISKGLYTKEYIIWLINTYVLDDSVQII